MRKVLAAQLFCNAHFSVISCSVEQDKIQRDNYDEREKCRTASPQAGQSMTPELGSRHLCLGPCDIL